MDAVRSCRSRSPVDRGGRSLRHLAPAAISLVVFLTGCVHSSSVPPVVAPTAGESRLSGLEAEVRMLREEVRRLEGENAKLQSVLERIKALELELEMKRRQVR